MHIVVRKTLKGEVNAKNRFNFFLNQTNKGIKNYFKERV